MYGIGLLKHNFAYMYGIVLSYEMKVSDHYIEKLHCILYYVYVVLLIFGLLKFNFADVCL